MFDSLLKLRETFLYCQQSFQPICLRILPTFYERFNQHFWDLDQESGKIKRDLLDLLEQHLKGWFL